MDQHNQAVTVISATVNDLYKRKEKFRIHHGSTNSTRPRSHANEVNIGHLNHIIKVDAERQVVLVEPNVPMDRLIEGTLPHGLVPPIVMEFPGITVGGGYAGTSGESSSFRHGFFDQTINWVEMVLADGSVVKCSRVEREDLFTGAAGAMGTLGITTLVELQLVKATKFVETTYHPVHSVAAAVKKLNEAIDDSSNDYVDGIMFSKSSGAIITGRRTTSPASSLPVRTFSNSRDPWFYLHVKQMVSDPTTMKVTSEAIPLGEYLFRYDRGCFWVGTSAFKYFRTPFNKLTRYLFDALLHTRPMYVALHASGHGRKYILQDLAIPYEHVEEFVDYTDKVFQTWPLWLCPLRTPATPTMHPTRQNSTGDSKMLNIGLWGPGPQDYNTFVLLNKDLEAKVQELQGAKWLYAHTYYSEDEFWQVYDRPWYDALRAKYDATCLPSVYDKVKIDTEKEQALSTAWSQRLPVRGFYGVWKALRSESLLTARKAHWRTRKRQGQEA